MSRPKAWNRQVFGLVAVSIRWIACLLVAASRLVRTSALLATVVATYRCGAVPDSHRVPSYDAVPVEEGTANRSGRIERGGMAEGQGAFIPLRDCVAVVADNGIAPMAENRGTIRV